MSGPLGTAREALGLLARHARTAYAIALLATLVNTVPDVARQVLVWDDPRYPVAAAVDVVGFLTGLVAQLWVTGALTALPTSGRPAPRSALRRGVGAAWTAVRTAPGTVLTGVALGGAVSALLTLPASVAALGLSRVIGPLDSPDVGAFAVAAVSDVVASTVTLPFLALVLVLVAGRSRLPSTTPGQ